MNLIKPLKIISMKKRCRNEFDKASQDHFYEKNDRNEFDKASQDHFHEKKKLK